MRAAIPLAEGLNKAKHILCARATLCTEMYRGVTPLRKQASGQSYYDRDCLANDRLTLYVENGEGGSASCLSTLVFDPSSFFFAFFIFFFAFFIIFFAFLISFFAFLICLFWPRRPPMLSAIPAII